MRFVRHGVIIINKLSIIESGLIMYEFLIFMAGAWIGVFFGLFIFAIFSGRK